jgi:SAM-dependent methyltransferase
VNDHVDSLRSAYDGDAPRRNGNVLEGWRVTVIDDFLSRLKAGGSVLELGSGTGQAAAYVADHGYSVTAIDLSPANVDLARERGIDAKVADFTDPAFDIGEFDGVFAMNSLLHVPKQLISDTIGHMRRSLRTGGIGLVVVWGGYNHEGTIEEEWTDPPRFFAFYSDEDFLALRTPGFRRLACSFRYEDTEDHMHPQVLVLEAV